VQFKGVNITGPSGKKPVYDSYETTNPAVVEDVKKFIEDDCLDFPDKWFRLVWSNGVLMWILKERIHDPSLIQRTRKKKKKQETVFYFKYIVDGKFRRELEVKEPNKKRVEAFMEERMTMTATNVVKVKDGIAMEDT